MDNLLKKISKYKYFFIVIFLFISTLLILDYGNYSTPPDDRYENFGKVSALHSITDYQYAKNGTDITFRNEKDPYFIVPFTSKSSFPKRVVISLAAFKNVRAVEIFYKFRGDVGYLPENCVRQFLQKNKKKYDFTLPAGDYEELRIDFIGSTRSESSITVTGLGLQPYSFFWFSRIFSFVLAFFLFALFILPGILLCLILLPDPKNSRKNIFIFMFPLSLSFYFSVYLIHVATIHLFRNNHSVPFVYFILALSLLHYLFIKNNKVNNFVTVLKESWKTFLCALLILFISLSIVISKKQKPFEDVSYGDMIEYKIFSVFNGGDNQFQYYNGTAIVNNEPFSKYYAHGQLVYGVQDRQMLAGTIYAAFRIILRNANTFISESYLTYTIFGICLNLMIIFPVIILFERYLPKGRHHFLLMVLSLNAFVFANYYYTWFKHAGGALFLSGLICLLHDSSKVKNWLLAGFMFGLSANMHAGNALGVPVVFLWFSGKEISKRGLFNKDILLLPVSLALMFIAVNMPWAIVKSLYYPDTHALLRQHFLNGVSADNGLVGSIKKFMELYPLSEQLTYRLSHIADSFRLHYLGLLYELFEENDYRRFFFYWSNYEFFFFIFTVYSLLFFLLISILGSFLSNMLKSDTGKSKISVNTSGTCNVINPKTKEMYILTGLSVITIYGLIFLYYGQDFSDINHVMPYGTLILVHMALITLIARTGRFGYAVMTLYMVFTSYRLFSIPF
ncbi:hypothetical protein VU01_10652 [Candidatus Electrothrix marina]|uniref:Uncharacterized protein n=1 Tax=Candidatus Electrothrix marina TaxID=1859130 RepID=A0A444JFL0_9BACT|nr:hypothetical protein VU01_10652 [Candidatus Electrothrix marina]